MPIRVVELFAGVGGFRLGLSDCSESFEFVWANQWEPGRKKQYAFDCYIGHFGESVFHVNDDISKVKDMVLEHDLLVGGFPCQDYSVASTGAKGIIGKKGVLWWEIRDIVEKMLPKYILLENVDRLLKSPTSQRGRDFGVILKTLGDLGYYVEWRVINAADYGNAQRRRRVFIFATRSNTHYAEEINRLFSKTATVETILTKTGFFAKSFPLILPDNSAISSIHIKDIELVELSKYFTFKFKKSGMLYKETIFTLDVESKKEDFIPLKNVISRRVVDDAYYITKNFEKWKYMKGSKRIPRIAPDGKAYFYSEGAIAFPDSLDKPARTMLTSESTLNRSTHIILDPHNDKLRKLTECECELLNGFSENWTNGYMPSRYRYFVMGNALVVPLITRMGKTLLELDSIKK